jgi:hypothetical protein
LTLHPGLPELTARIIAEMLRRSLETTLELSCEAPIVPGFVSFNSLLDGFVFCPLARFTPSRA